MKRILAGLIAAVAISFFVPAKADTFSTPNINFASEPAGKYTTGAFDFGVEFARIDSVKLELTTVPQISQGFCSGSSCNFSWLATVLHEDSSFPPEFPSPSPFYDLSGGYSGGTLYGEVNGGEAFYSPLNAYSVSNYPPISPEWPEFLMEGESAVSLQVVNFWSCYLNCSGSGQSVTAPVGPIAGRLVIEGTAVPEPATLALLLSFVFCIPNRDRRLRLCVSRTRALYRETSPRAPRRGIA
jgi:hypothetical protein